MPSAALVNEVNDQDLTGVENKLGDASLFTAANAKTSAAMKDTHTNMARNGVYLP